MLATHASLWFGAFFILLLLSRMLRERRNPSASAAWLVFMLAVPYLGVPLYFALGTRKLRSLARQKHRLFEGRTSSAFPERPVQHLLATLGVPTPAPATHFRLHQNACTSHSRLQSLLNEACHSIDIEIFILAGDTSGQGLINQLIQCVQRGVHVRVLLDGVGSFLLSQKHLQPLIDSGGKVTWFIPVLHRPLRGRTNLRNHRKLVLIDCERLWSGGRNLADEYLLDETETHWYDLSFECQGAAVLDYQVVFEADWAFANKTNPKTLEWSPTRSDKSAMAHQLQILPSGPDMDEDVLEQTLVSLIRDAQRQVTVVTPYYVPSETLQNLLRISALSGVRVDLVLPQRSNHCIADFVRNRFLRELHKAGVNIQVLPEAMLHAKAWVIDDKYALIGSANMDLRSLYLNFELMTLLYAQADVAAVQRWIEARLEQTRPWPATEPNALRETLEGLAMLLSFQL